VAILPSVRRSVLWRCHRDGLRQVELTVEFSGRDLYLAEDLSQQRTGDVSSRMVGDGGGSAVGVAIEDVATALP
jgi:hypothetical protein